MPGVIDASDDLMGAWAAAEQHAAARESGEEPSAPAPAAPAEKQRDGSGKFVKADATPKKEASAPTEGQEEAAGTTDSTAPKPGVRPEGKPAAKPAAANDGAAQETALSQLHELAKKHGFIVEDAKVLPRERHAFREERRAARQKLEQERAQFLQERENILNQIRGEGSSVIAAKRALDAGDFDGFAKALGAADWNEINSRVINQFADPNYRKLQELERREREREAQAQKQREEQTRLQAAQEEARARAEYQQQLAASMAESEDPFVAAMHDDPAFVAAVFNIQRDHWDGAETISVEEAVRLKPRNGGSPLIEQLRTLYSKLSKAGVFNDGDASPPAAERRETGTRDAQRPAKKSPPTTISQKDASEAASPRTFKSEADFMRYANEQLEAAALRDREEARKRKAG